MEIGSRRAHDQRPECSRDQFEPQAMDLEKGLHFDPLGRPAVVFEYVEMTDHEQAATGEILGGEWP